MFFQQKKQALYKQNIFFLYIYILQSILVFVMSKLGVHQQLTNSHVLDWIFVYIHKNNLIYIIIAL